MGSQKISKFYSGISLVECNRTIWWTGGICI